MGLTRPKYSNIVDGDFKNSCRIATIGNIANLEGGCPLVYDSVTLAQGDRILVTAQDVGSDNGIYVVHTAGSENNGTWRRAFDANSSDRLNGGAQTSVSEGSYAGSIWRLVTPDPLVVGVTALTWVSGAAAAGGANRQVQYNNSGVLTGTDLFLVDNALANIVVTGGLIKFDSNNSNWGSLVVAGGLGVQKGVSIATHLNVETGPAYIASLNSPNVFISGGSIGVATNGTVQPVANVYATQGVVTNFSTGNAVITGGSITGITVSASTLQVDNFSSANIYQSAAGTFVATNLSTGNIRATSGSITGTTGAFTKLQVDNFSSANIYQSAADTFVATNLSTGNLRVTGGSIIGGTGAYTTLQADNFGSANIYQSAAGTLVATNFSSGNIYQSAAGTLVVTNLSTGNLYQSAADTFVTTNFSSGNIRVTGGSATGVTLAATTLVATNFSSANIYQSAADTFVATNLSSGNLRVTGGSATGITGAATTLQADNFSGPNVRITGGSLIGVTGAYTTLQADNFSSANIYQSAAGTLVATNLSSGNIYQSAAGTLVVTNLSTGNLYQSAAGTLVATNFSSGNARITGGYADNFPIGANVRAPGYFSIMNAHSDSAVYANLTIAGNLTVFGNITTVGSSDLTLADSIINLHTFANLDPLGSNDGRDIGIKMHYFDTQDSHAFIGRANDTGFLEWYAKGTETTGNVFVGSYYGTIKAGEFLSVNNVPSTSTTSGAIRVTGGVGIGDGLYVNGKSWFQNASTANAVITGGSLTGVTGAYTTLQADNFSSSNVRITGGSLVGVTEAATTLVATNFSSANIYQSAADTFVATNFSSGNVRITGGSLVGVTEAATTLVATNFSSANIYQSAADTFVATNLSSGNLRVTGGSIVGGTGAFTTLVATNFSSANIYQSAAGTLVATNFSSGNIYQSAADTFVATNFSSGNIRVTGGSATGVTMAATTLVAANFSSANIYQSAAGTLVATNFSSGNVQMTGGFITASGTVQPSANGTINLGGTSSYWNNVYSVTAYYNTVIVGAGGVTTTDGNLAATSAITGTGNVVITGNIYQNGIVKRAIQYTPGASPHASPQPGDQWYDTVNDTLYEYLDDGTNRYWIDITGQAPYVSYTASTNAPLAPKSGDQWYDTATDVLYTRVTDGVTNYWIDYSTQATANTINSSTTIVQPCFGGTGVTDITGLVKGNGTSPFTAAVPGVDYLAIAANGVAVNSTLAAVDVNVADTVTAGTVNTGYLFFSQYLSGTNASFGGLDVAQGNVTAGNIQVNYDMVGMGNLTFGNVTANNFIQAVNLVYSGNISYEGNLNVLNLNASNVYLGDFSGGTYIDATRSLRTYAPSATVDFSNFSGTIVVTSATTGITVLYLCGGQSATAIGASKTGIGFGAIAYEASINGYRWTNNSGGSLDISFAATKTLNTA